MGACTLGDGCTQNCACRDRSYKDLCKDPCGNHREACCDSPEDGELADGSRECGGGMVLGNLRGSAGVLEHSLRGVAVGAYVHEGRGDDREGKGGDKASCCHPDRKVYP